MSVAVRWSIPAKAVLPALRPFQFIIRRLLWRRLCFMPMNLFHVALLHVRKYASEKKSPETCILTVLAFGKLSKLSATICSVLKPFSFSKFSQRDLRTLGNAASALAELQSCASSSFPVKMIPLDC